MRLIWVLGFVFGVCLNCQADDKILAYWDFEKVQGRDVPELTNVFDGVLFNGTDPYIISGDGLGPKIVQGHTSGSHALSLNGPNRKDPKIDSMFIGKGYQFKLGQSDWTLAGWIRCVGFPKKQTDHMTVMSNLKPRQNGINLIVLRPGHPSHGRLNVALRGPDKDRPVFVNSKKRIDDGQWHWFAIRVSDKKLSLWLDGQKQGQRAFTDHTTADPSGMLFFGTRDGHHGAFHGDLDDLLVYRNAITGRTDQSGLLVGGKLFDLWKKGIKALEH